MEPCPRILLVDDAPAITGQLRPFLERAGFRVLCAVDGRDALGKQEAGSKVIVHEDCSGRFAGG